MDGCSRAAKHLPFTLIDYTPTMDRPAVPFPIAGITGLALWTATAVLGGGREPWDTGLYWTMAYPVALGISAALGLIYPHRSWRWATILIGSQLVVMPFTGSGLSLLPFGLIALAVLSLPAIALAKIASIARLRFWP